MAGTHGYLVGAYWIRLVLEYLVDMEDYRTELSVNARAAQKLALVNIRGSAETEGHL